MSINVDLFLTTTHCGFIDRQSSGCNLTLVSCCSMLEDTLSLVCMIHPSQRDVFRPEDQDPKLVAINFNQNTISMLTVQPTPPELMKR